MATVCTVPSEDLGSSPPRCVSTDRGGHFALGTLDSDVETIIASAPGHLPHSHILRGGGEQGWDDLSPVTLILESGGADVSGSVLDATGGPVPFAMVTIRSTREQHATALIQADSDGEFAAAVPDGEVDVTALAEAYSQATVRVRAPAHGVTLMLAPSAEVVGRVVHAETEEPVVGVGVLARPALGEAEIPRTAISGSDGAFRVVGLSGAVSYEISMSSSAWRSNTAWVRLSVGQQSAPVVLRASRATTLTGTVLVAGEPCRDASVIASGPVSAAANAGVDGSVRLDGLLPGRYRVLIQCPAALSREEQVEVADEPVSRVWAVDPGLSIHGRVETASGQPVAAAVVSAISVGGLEKGGVSCTTEGNGQFTCTGMRTGVYDCSVDQDSDPQRELVRVSLDEHFSEPVVLRMRPAGAIRVAVNKSYEAPRLIRALARGEALVPIEGVPFENGFFFKSMPLGRYEVYLDGGEPQDVRLERDQQVVDLELDLPDYALSIQGRALDEHGSPIADAWVSVSRSDATQPSSANETRTLTDDEGSFAVHDLARGTYRLHVKTATGEGAVHEIAAGSTGVIVQVPTQT